MRRIINIINGRTGVVIDQIDGQNITLVKYDGEDYHGWVFNCFLEEVK